MSRSRDNPEDLSALARRGMLSESEERELDAELVADPVLRLAHRVGVDFDRSTAVRAGDDELVARAASKALAQALKSDRVSGDVSRPSGFRLAKSPRRRRVASILIAAAVVSVTGLAAAIWSGVVALPRARAPEEPVEFSWERRAREPMKHRDPAASAREPTEGDDRTPAPDAVEAPSEARAPLRAPVRQSGEDAASLFRAANSARHDGEFGRAEHLYSELIARYPSSDEARLARVSLGKLHLAQGAPSDAERQFSQYLKGGKGQLAEEALVSRAQSLERLGRSDDEKGTWQRLLAEHPNSVYASQAKQRLEALRMRGAPSAP